MISRRQFLDMVGAAAGSAAVYQAGLALGLIPESAAAFAALKPLGRAKRRVVILGAGLSGLTSAYELERAGYSCTVLEASFRPGGRNLTIRGGDKVDELGNQQTCEFDRQPHLYFNAGPARIPAHHKQVLHYCRKLQVPLEVFVNDNHHAYVQDPKAFDGKPVRSREFVTDARGFMSELLAKSIKRDEFDMPFSRVDGERMLEFVRAYGDLNVNDLYTGSSRAGYQAGGMITPGVKKGTLDISEILKSDFWRYRMHWAESEDQAGPLLQPVGGMDNIIKAFVREVKSPIHTNAQVQSIRLKDHAVDVVYQHRGEHHKISADYCLNSIPKHILTGIDHNFPSDYAIALASIPRGKLFKLALQMRERFWERDGIYGGITWTGQAIEQLWYPTHGIHAEKGVMLGAYTFSDRNAEFFARMTPGERVETAIVQAERVHPGYRGYVESGVSVAWHRMNHMLGCTAAWTEALRRRFYHRLQTPVGRHYLIGDQISYHPGWQEGALASAHHAMADLDRRVGAELVGA